MNWEKEQKGILHSILEGEIKMEKKEDSILYTVPPEELVRMEVRVPKKTFNSNPNSWMDLREFGATKPQVADLREGRSVIIVVSPEKADKIWEAYEKGLIFKPIERRK